MNTDGLQAIKDIQKLTGSNLDIAPLEIDVTMMRQFVHTPKNGVKIPMDTSQIIKQLRAEGRLEFEPEDSATVKMNKIYKDRQQSIERKQIVKTDKSDYSPSRSSSPPRIKAQVTMTLGQVRSNL